MRAINTVLFRKFSPVAIVVTAAALAGVFMFANITRSSVWHDEGFTMMLAPQSPSQIIARTARDVHPPAHYLALHYWMQVFGESELSARGLSALFIIITVISGYFLSRRLFDQKFSTIIVFTLAMGPFLLRYGQEARMYAMVAMLAIVSSWLLVRSSQDNKPRDWLLYGISIALALYTHYYAIFIIAAQGIYMLSNTKPKRGIFRPGYWLSSLLALLAFSPWVPVAYSQFTKVQGGFWIPKISSTALSATMAQYLSFTDMGFHQGIFNLALIRNLLAILFVVALIIAFVKHKSDRSGLILISGITLIGPIVVFILSFVRPIYVERYFVFSAAAFYILLAYLISALIRPRPARLLVSACLIVTMLVGIRNVYHQSNHKMRYLAGYVTANLSNGDAVISGELYTFFDSSYYFKPHTTVRAYTPGDFPGCCEGRSLLYDHPELLLRSYADLDPSTKNIWVVGKAGPHDYFENVPSPWTKSAPLSVFGYVAVQKYTRN